MRRDPIMFDADAGSGSGLGSGSGGGSGSQSDAATQAAMLDPANESLADALKLLFRVIQFAMVVLGVLYVASGFQTIKEGEQGIRLLFGKVTGKLDPGARWSAPFPLGEIVRVTSGSTTVTIDDAFWVELQAGTPLETSPEKLPQTPSLAPKEKSGSLLTADGGIAHVRVSASYRRTDAARFAQNILPEDETELFRYAIQCGVVHAVAGTRLDDLLKQSGSDPTSAASRAKITAQKFLDDVGSGIVIDSVNFPAVMPPTWTRNEFAKVQAAVANSAKVAQNALGDAQKVLNEVAGSAAPALIEAINAYERTLESGTPEVQARALREVEELLGGKEVEHGGRKVVVSGEVSSVMKAAESYKSEVLSQRQARLADYQSKLASFRANPSVWVQSEWTRALDSFLGKPVVDVMMIPPGTRTVELQLNPDPSYAKTRGKVIRENEAREMEKKRLQQQQQERFKTQTGVTAVSG